MSGIDNIFHANPGLARPISLVSVAAFSNFLMAGSFGGLYPSNGTMAVGPTSGTSTDGLRLALPTNADNGA